MTAPEGWPEPGPFIGLDAVREDVEVVAHSGNWVAASYRSLFAVRRAASNPTLVSPSPIESKTASSSSARSVGDLRRPSKPPELEG
jgi:hypothetical protein